MKRLITLAFAAALATTAASARPHPVKKVAKIFKHHKKHQAKKA